MTTRGAVGFFVRGKEKVTYSESDSYPAKLGKEVLDFCLAYPVAAILDAASRVELVDTEEDGESFAGLDSYMSGARRMLDCKDFLLDSLFCEYAYIINLDTEKLEFYLGQNKSPRGAGRYGGLKETPSAEYYGVVLVREWPLNVIRACKENGARAIVKEMERLSRRGDGYEMD